MFIFILIIIALIVLFIILPKSNLNSNLQNNNTSEKNYNLSRFYSKKYVMTPTELLFYKELKKITDKLQMEIFPQVDLERFIHVNKKTNTPIPSSSSYNSDRNRIKSRSVDYTLVNNVNRQIICCIELDDYSHNNRKVQEKDDFKDKLFEKVNIPLIRFRPQYTYNLEEIENTIKKYLQ